MTGRRRSPTTPTEEEIRIIKHHIKVCQEYSYSVARVSSIVDKYGLGDDYAKLCACNFYGDSAEWLGAEDSMATQLIEAIRSSKKEEEKQ